MFRFRHIALLSALSFPLGRFSGTSTIVFASKVAVKHEICGLVVFVPCEFIIRAQDSRPNSKKKLDVDLTEYFMQGYTKAER
jgi:hypothetical protein